MWIAIQNAIGARQGVGGGPGPGPGYTPPLDSLTGSYAGWSLRKLRTAYAGPCVQIRRSIVPAGLASSTDVNFNDDFTLSLDSTISTSGPTSATNLGEFLGVTAEGYDDADSLGSSASAFIATLYDQVGGSDVSGGAGNRQAILFDGTTFSTDTEGLLKIDLKSNSFNGSLSNTQTVPQPYFYFVVNAFGGGAERLLEEGAQFKLLQQDTQMRQYDGVTVGTVRNYPYTGTRQVFAGNWDGASSFLRAAGTEIGNLNVGSASQNVITFGHSGGSVSGLQEVILYQSTPSLTDIESMEANMTSYYSL